jgi:hypothetical protein
MDSGGVRGARKLWLGRSPTLRADRGGTHLQSAKDCAAYAHMRAVMLVWECLVGLFEIRFVVQYPSIDVAPEDNPGSAPEPDIVVLAQPFRACPRSPLALAGVAH